MNFALRNFFKKKGDKMKFRVLKNIWLGRNQKTGQTGSCNKGDVIELGLDDIEQIESLIRDLAIVPIDDGLIKNNARYKILYSFKIEFEGETVTGKAGAEVIFSREIATRLLASGHIKPTNENSWYPGQRDFKAGQIAKAKTMYDDLDAETENQPGFITSWKEGK